MIKNFTSKFAEDIFNGEKSKLSRLLPIELHAKAQRLFDQINASYRLESLQIPPGNMLETLRGDLKGYFSIRINKQWRIIFRWKNGNAFDVNIVDYHK